MTEPMNMRQTIWLYRIAIIWGLLFIADAIITAIWGALQNIVWKNLDPQAKFLLLLFIGKSSFTAIMAYLSNSARKISDGKVPINGSSDTVAFVKTDASPVVATAVAIVADKPKDP